MGCAASTARVPDAVLQRESSRRRPEPALPRRASASKRLSVAGARERLGSVASVLSAISDLPLQKMMPKVLPARAAPPKVSEGAGLVQAPARRLSLSLPENLKLANSQQRVASPPISHRISTARVRVSSRSSLLRSLVEEPEFSLGDGFAPCVSIKLVDGPAGSWRLQACCAPCLNL